MENVSVRYAKGMENAQDAWGQVIMGCKLVMSVQALEYARNATVAGKNKR